MNTPLIDFLRNYADSNTVRAHMPGHKGTLSRYDITEIHGADSLFEADGIISMGERNTAQLYGSYASYWSAGGSTLCIQAMLLAMKQDGRSITAVRNVHRSFVNTCSMLNLDVDWILPDYDNGILSGTINPQTVEKHIRKNGRTCLYVTSPDYTGRMADIRTLAEICHKYGAPLLVDNAHGAHLAFMPENVHPIALGADMCCDSMHKMLVGLTGSAVLHTSSEYYAPKLKHYMGMFGSTSPSYLILASLDYCNKYIDKKIRHDIVNNIWYTEEFRWDFNLDSSDGDPFHITIKLQNHSGNDIAQIMRENGAECEYSDENIIILLMSPRSTRDDYKRLEDALWTAIKTAEKRVIPDMPFLTELPEKAMSMGEAVFLPSEEVPVETAEGRVCASVNVPCPPAVPIAVCGEVINRECIEIFKRYNIRKVMVVK